MITCLLTVSCGGTRPTVQPAAPVIDIAGRLASADALLRVGCYDCLAQALHEYEAIGGVAAAAHDLEAAGEGRLRAMLLLGLRQRELGTADDGYIREARSLLEDHGEWRHIYRSFVDAAAAMPSRIVRFDVPEDPEARRRLTAFRESVPALLATWRSIADLHPFAAYGWVAFSCAHGGREDRTSNVLSSPLVSMGDSPLVQYRMATCLAPVQELLARLLDAEPRFQEIHYWLAQAAMGRVRPDEAEPHFIAAHAWNPRWPAVTRALGDLYFAFEEPGRALDFYDETLALVPGHPDAQIGRVRSLSLLRRHDEAFQLIDGLLAVDIRHSPGELFYWRAWNDLQVRRQDDAWADIEQANRLWVNSEVAKLGGLIAYDRADLATARARFAQAQALAPGDCDAPYYLGLVHADLRDWSSSVTALHAAAPCLEGTILALRQEIQTIRASSSTAEERKAAQITRREARVATATRMIAVSWFNVAVGNFNLGRFEDARRYARHVEDDTQFSERVEAMLKRMPQ